MEPGAQLPDKLLSRISIAKQELERSAEVRVVSHYDADGISSAGVLCNALLRAGKRFHATLTKVLTDRMVEEVAAGCEFLILSDMGSAQLDALEASGCRAIVLDHHTPLRDSEKVVHINPHLVGIDGMTSASASAMCMLFAVHLDEANWDLLPIAFAGISGDRQAIRGLTGINQWLYEEGAKRGIVETLPGSLVPAGPLADGLYASTDPYVRGVSGDREGAQALLEEAGIAVDASSRDLDDAARMKLSSLLALRLAEQGVGLPTLEEVVHERYYFPRARMEADELAGLLNACGRSNNEGMGLALTLGDQDALQGARKLRQEYVEEVLAGLERIAREGVERKEHIQYFRNENLGLAGILCGVTMQYLGDRDKPTIALSPSDDGTKVSSRGTFELLEKGIDLAVALRESAASVGGTGGGHRIASGATVPKGREDEFLATLDRVIGEQKAKKA